VPVPVDVWQEALHRQSHANSGIPITLCIHRGRTEGVRCNGLDSTATHAVSSSPRICAWVKLGDQSGKSAAAGGAFPSATRPTPGDTGHPIQAIDLAAPVFLAERFMSLSRQ
jgi:hypothetical protein